ncbi:MAG: NVEALA domain-containing protein [Mediterranea sp.]|jgi:hypothetical protein|nr:NVEALA domain-containing protein [Mediterranea sp.]
MEKYLLRAAFAAALGLAVSYTVYTSQKDEPVLSDVVLDNIEALASGETTLLCKGYGSVLCSYNNIWVYSQE